MSVQTQQEIKSYRFNPMCKECKKKCKQWDSVNIVCCPNFTTDNENSEFIKKKFAIKTVEKKKFIVH